MSSDAPFTVPSTPSSELTKTFGVLLIGFIFTVTLYGLTFFQTYIYYTRFPTDPKVIKYMVGVLWALDTAVTSLVSHTIYRYLITNFIVPFQLLTTTSTFIAAEALSVLLALVVQCYFTFRVWTISGRRSIVPTATVVVAVASFAIDLASVVKMTDQSLFAQVVTRVVKVTRGIGSGLSAATDVIIVLSMFWYLRPSRNPGMALPRDLYEKVVVYGVNRGTFFTVFQITALVTLVTMPSQQVWILFHWVGSKVYINSILSMLNFRNTHHGRGVPEEASMNRHARGRGLSGTFTSRSGASRGTAGQVDTSHSVHFNVHADAKTTEAMNIELDMVRSRDLVDDDADMDVDADVDVRRQKG
ncbi:hypothetical protein BD413DRAFT_206954 [Trametes elegans]|nr:hypothetical protein BD413DRAFT_206954 [Trametes elegans]